MLPTGRLSGVEFLVKSKYICSLAGAARRFGVSDSLATVWKGACDSFHSTLAILDPKIGS
jgi:hypothetical protein